MYLDFMFGNSSAQELSNPYCRIAMVALERHSNTYGLSRHKSANTWISACSKLLRHAPDYNGMKEVMLPVTNTCTIPGEMWAGFFAIHTHAPALFWKNTKGLSEQPWSRHTLLPPANLFISAPVSQLRPTWHTARLFRFKPPMTWMCVTVQRCGVNEGQTKPVSLLLFNVCHSLDRTLERPFKSNYKIV